MSFLSSLFGSHSGSTQSNTNGQSLVFPQYTGLQISSSSNSLPIPIIYGFNKIGLSLIYYRNFSNHPIAQWTGSTWIITGYTYTADLEFALCEGPIAGIGQIFDGQSQSLFPTSPLNPLGLSLGSWGQPVTLFKGTTSQNPWSGVAPGTNPAATAALYYRNIAYIAAGGYNLGTNASFGNPNFEVGGILYGTGFNSIDADPALVIQDFLTNPQYGAGLLSSDLDLTTLLGGSGSSSTQTYCWVLGFAFSPVILQQEAANSIVTRWLQLLNCAAFFSGGKLKIVPYGDLNVTGTDATTWTAPITSVATLDDNAFLAKGNDDPVKIERIDPLNLYTSALIEVLNREGVNLSSAIYAQQQSQLLAVMQLLAHQSGTGTLPQPQGQPQYTPQPVYARDGGMTQNVGLRQGPAVTAHEICDLDTASRMIQLILQRQLYLRRKLRFTLDWRYCLLDPMDVVTLNESYLGLVNATVRITSITENDDGTLDFEAEDFIPGVSTPGYNVTSGPSVQTANATAAPQPVESMFVFQAPSTLTGGVASFVFGAVGGFLGSRDPNWGGAYIWASVNGSNFGSNYVGTIPGPAVIGELTASFPSASGWDTTNTLSVSVKESGQTLSSTTLADAQAGTANLALVGREIIAFETATLVSPGVYNLTNIQRQFYSSVAASPAPTGTGFALLQQNTATVSILPSWVTAGTVYFAFQSFNVFGGGTVPISGSTPTVTLNLGVGADHPTFWLCPTPLVSIPLSGTSILTLPVMPIGGVPLKTNWVVNTSITGSSSVRIDPQYTAAGAAGPTSGTWGALGSFTAGSAGSFTITGAATWTVVTETILTMSPSATAGNITLSLQYSISY